MKWLSLLSVFVLSAAYTAQSQPRNQTFLDPSQAGPDYQVQGEYTNSWGGAQVIAMGNGHFRMVTYQGGLPGDGWNGENRQVTSGARQGDEVVFTGSDGYHAELANGKITIRTDSGGPWTMTKTVRQSPTLGEKPPSDALVLFDGTSARDWIGGHMDARHLLAAGCRSRARFTNFTAHLEFLVPFKPFARGQERGNSGVYVQGRYEIQVLDSFGRKTSTVDCGGIYSQAKPLLNMCYPPLTWQTYDIDFTAAKFDDAGNKTHDAVLTVKQNGVTILDHLQLKGPTPGGRRESPRGGPLLLQGHGNPVFYRNVWVVRK